MVHRIRRSLKKEGLVAACHAMMFWSWKIEHGAYRGVIRLRDQGLIFFPIELDDRRVLGVKSRIDGSSSKESRNGEGNGAGVNHFELGRGLLEEL